jgi:hypothetical protein
MPKYAVSEKLVEIGAFDGKKEESIGVGMNFPCQFSLAKIRSFPDFTIWWFFTSSHA